MSSTPEAQEQFWIKLEIELEETYEWPAVYCYKFILPTVTESLETLRSIFEKYETEITYRESSTKKYTSVTINTAHDAASEIIECYKQAVLIEGIKSL